MIIKGTAMWAKVFEPDTRFVPEGEYSAQVIVPEAEAAEVCEQLEKLIEVEFAKAVKEKPALKATLSKRPVAEPQLDDAGDPTGNVIFKTKLKARIKTKAGIVKEQKVFVYDAKKNLMPSSVAVGNGSVIKVAVEPFPYVMQSTKQVGVSLRLKGVQVIDLVEYGAPAASMFDEEDGYVAEAVAKDDMADSFDDSDTVDADDQGDF